jgi:flagellar assembly protein FliH
VQFDESKETILQMIEGTITDIEGSRKFHIKVNPANYAFLEAHKYEIQNKVSSDSEIEFVQDNLLDMNDCVIETESGVYDCGLDVQLNNLFRELRSLSVVEG